MNDFNRAIADFSEAIRLDPNLTSAYKIRALTYRYDQSVAIITSLALMTA